MPSLLGGQSNQVYWVYCFSQVGITGDATSPFHTLGLESVVSASQDIKSLSEDQKRCGRKSRRQNDWSNSQSQERATARRCKHCRNQKYPSVAYLRLQHFQQPDRSLHPTVARIAHAPDTHPHLRSPLVKPVGFTLIESRAEEASGLTKLLHYHVILCNLRVGCMLGVI